MEMVRAYMLCECAQVFYAEGRFGREIDPDGADCGLRVGFGFCREGCVFCVHGVGGSEGGVHSAATGEGRVSVGAAFRAGVAEELVLRGTVGVGELFSELVQRDVEFFF